MMYVFFVLVAISELWKPLLPEALYSSRRVTAVMDPQQNPAATHYLHVLSAMKESTLRNGSSREAYQILYLPSFTSPFLFQVAVEPSGSGALISKSIKNTDSKLDLLCLHHYQRLSKSVLDHIRHVFGQLEFWQMTSIVEGVHILDGSIVVVEARLGSMYHAVEILGLEETLAPWVNEIIQLSGQQLDTTSPAYSRKLIQDRIESLQPR
jgi:hypothetical protein